MYRHTKCPNCGLHFSIHKAATVCKWFRTTLDFSVIVWPRVALYSTHPFFLSWIVQNSYLHDCRLFLAQFFFQAPHFNIASVLCVCFVFTQCINSYEALKCKMYASSKKYTFYPCSYIWTESSKTIFIAKKSLWSPNSISHFFLPLLLPGEQE